MLANALQKFNEDDLKIRLTRINNRINELIKTRKLNVDAKAQDDISRLRQLRVLVEQEINMREMQEFLK